MVAEGAVMEEWEEVNFIFFFVKKTIFRKANKSTSFCTARCIDRQVYC